jgi:hypothetical protein
MEHNKEACKIIGCPYCDTTVHRIFAEIKENQRSMNNKPIFNPNFMTNKYIEEVLKDFDEYFVEMHPMFGHDMHNRPILYDTETDEVQEIRNFISSSLSSYTTTLLSEVEKMKLKLDYTDGRVNRNAKFYDIAISDIINLIKNNEGK